MTCALCKSEAPDVGKQSLQTDGGTFLQLHKKQPIIRHDVSWDPLKSDAGLPSLLPDCLIVFQIGRVARDAPSVRVSPPPPRLWPQTPPPLRSTATGSLLSRVSSAALSRTARRLTPTFPFFTALMSCRGDGREKHVQEGKQRRKTHRSPSRPRCWEAEMKPTPTGVLCVKAELGGMSLFFF